MTRKCVVGDCHKNVSGRGSLARFCEWHRRLWRASRQREYTRRWRKHEIGPMFQPTVEEVYGRPRPSSSRPGFGLETTSGEHGNLVVGNTQGRKGRTPSNAAGNFYCVRLSPEIPQRIKLGFSKDIFQRMQSYKTANPTLELLASWQCRRQHEKPVIHTVVKALNAKKVGNEVFDFPDVEALLAAIRGYFATCGYTEVVDLNSALEQEPTSSESPELMQLSLFAHKGT